MTHRCLHIGIRTRREGELALRMAFERVHRGNLTPQEPRLYFENAEDLRCILTNERLDILLAIVQHHPRLIQELADRLGRDSKNVSEDTEILQQIGLVEMEERGSQGEPKTPVVPYDEIHVTIALRAEEEARAA